MTDLLKLRNKIAQLEKENLDLRKDRDFYKKIIDEIQVMIHINEIKDNKYFDIVWMNDFYLTDIGLNIEERNADEKAFYKNHYTPRGKEEVAKYISALKKNPESLSGVYKFITKNGDERWQYSIGTPYKFSADGELTHVLYATINITGHVLNPEIYNDLTREINKLKHELVLSELTSTEIRILELLAEGKSEKEISDIQNRSIHTTKTHLKNIRRKLKLGKNIELVKFACSTGIV